MVFGLYIYKPVWKPKFTWAPETVRYFIRFGWQNLIVNLIYNALDQVDDLWTGTYLGKTPLGYYSRAFTFATYPRRILAVPVNTVSSGTYAELKEDRVRLAKAFFRTNAFLLRTGFLFAGLLTLMAPEFIIIFLGTKWLPMLTTFRLMLIFTLLDPIKITIGNLFVALGKPQLIARANFIQLGVLIFGLYTLGYIAGINGVAITVDIMLLVGMGLLLFQARQEISFSIKSLLFAPGVSLVISLALGWLCVFIPAINNSDWIKMLLKGFVFTSFYIVLLFLMERDALIRAFQYFQKQLFDGVFYR